MTMLYLVRHAEQERAPAGECGGEHPAAGLSALGREQARRLGERLRAVPLDGLHHSPVLRAEETALLLARSLPGLPVLSSPWLTDRTPMPSPGRENEYSEADRSWLATTPPAEQDPGGGQITAAMDHFASLGDTHHLLVGPVDRVG